MAAPGPAEEAALRDAIGGPPDPETPVAAIMTTDVLCVRADMDAQLIEALLIERGISGVPVVDERGKPIGVVSRADLLRLSHERDDTVELERVTATGRDQLGLGPGYHVHEPARATAGDIMTPVVLTLHESANMGQAASLMAYEGVHRLPIVSDGGEVVGTLSSLDILRWFSQRSGYLVPKRPSREHG